MKVHQITEAGVLDSLLGKVRDIVDPTANRPQTANSATASASAQSSRPASSSNELPSPLTQELTQTIFPAIDRAIQSEDRQQLLNIITAGPTAILQRTGRQIQIDTNQHLRDSFERRLRREIIKYMANKIEASRLPGTARNDWYAFGRRDSRRFVDMVLNPALASEMR